MYQNWSFNCATLPLFKLFVSLLAEACVPRCMCMHLNIYMFISLRITYLFPATTKNLKGASKMRNINV